jgi:phosphocarrier protein HPr
MVQKEITIKNRAGIHARPAALIVELATRFESKITFEYESERINGKSIMGIIALGAHYNSVLILIAEGRDEQQAVEAISALFDRRFEEESVS